MGLAFNLRPLGLSRTVFCVYRDRDGESATRLRLAGYAAAGWRYAPRDDRNGGASLGCVPRDDRNGGNCLKLLEFTGYVKYIIRMNFYCKKGLCSC